ncbi:MAG: hypothetical protein ABIG92_02710 [Candidatus Omnitrophota bacterium]
MFDIDMKSIVYILLVVILSASPLNAEEDKEISYLKEIVSIITEADVTVRSISFDHILIKDGVKKLEGYVERLDSLECPPSFSRQYKMTSLSLKKMRMAFLFFSVERREYCRMLVKNGAMLLKEAAMDIKNIAKEKGLINEERGSQ